MKSLLHRHLFLATVSAMVTLGHAPAQTAAPPAPPPAPASAPAPAPTQAAPVAPATPTPPPAPAPPPPPDPALVKQYEAILNQKFSRDPGELLRNLERVGTADAATLPANERFSLRFVTSDWAKVREELAQMPPDL